MSRTNISHGKESSYWCDSCGTLILGRSCSECKARGRRFEINSPGDIRPCFSEAHEILAELFRDTFGTSEIIDNKAVFFNKVPGEDRTDEIIAHGEVLGLLRFDMSLNKLLIELRQPGADFLSDKATKNIVSFSGMSGHLKGKNIPGDKVEEIIGTFEKGESIIVKRVGGRVGSGIAHVSSEDMKAAKRAFKIRDFNPVENRCISPDSGRDEFVRTNRKHIDELSVIAISEIQTSTRSGAEVTVSFSGGKDSLVAFSLTEKALRRKPIMMFIDTGLEYPETVEYVRNFAEEGGYDLRIADAGNAFWENVGSFGPPAKDFRWCCKVCKLGPITDLIESDFPEGTITVEGNRSLESFSRSGTPLISKNPFVPNQINVNPIRNWRSADVWCYIWTNELKYNPLYDRDFERIGCYLCASCLSSEWRNTERIHPDLYENWENYLHEYAESRGLPPEYVDMGFWRWKSLPPKMTFLADRLNLHLAPASVSGVSMKLLKGASVCETGGYSAEAVVSLPISRDFSYVAETLRTIGEVKYSSEFEIAVVKSKKGTAKVLGGGQVSVVSDSRENTEKLFERTVKALVRAMMCTSCGICVKACKYNAVTISGGIKVDPSKCTSCGACEKSCMVIHYYDRLMENTENEKH